MKLERSRKTVLRKAFHNVFTELAKLCIRFDIPQEEVEEAFKACMVQAAKDRLESLGDTPTKSRVALMARISRKEVARLWNMRQMEEKPSAVSTVLERWRKGKRWQGPDGKPRDLPIRGPRSFTALCEACSFTGYTVRSFLDQLEALGNIEALPNGEYRLISSETVPHDFDEQFSVGIRNLIWHIRTIIHNLENPDQRWFENTTGTKNIPRSKLGHVRDECDQEGRRSARRVLEMIENAEGEAECDTAVLGYFYYEKQFEDK